MKRTHKLIIALASIALVGCATQDPEALRNTLKASYSGGDGDVVRDHAECSMKADEKAGGVGTTAMTVLFWPIGVAMMATGVMNAASTMKLCMTSKGWTEARK